MATLPETPQWEDGIYQIEVSDPVLGGPDGITNRPAKQLASRTSYLKQQVEKGGTDLAAHIAAADPHTQYAPKASPVLTGIPTAPTAAQSTNNTQLATTAFVQAGLALKAPLVSPALTGIPTAPTATPTTNNTQLATTAFVKAALAALVASSPEALDTLNELAAALGNDPNFATTMTNALAGKQPLDNTLTDLSGKTVSGLLQYLGLGDGTGRLTNVKVITSSETYIPTPGTKRIVVECQGGGGGGGGAALVPNNTNASVGAGGAAGAYAKHLITALAASYSVVIGAGGTGGTGESSGSNGGTTSFGSVISCSGGGGGAAIPAGTTPLAVTTNAYQAVITGGNISSSNGISNTMGLRISGSVFYSGVGGSSAFGEGSSARAVSGNGGTSTAYGSGGSGAANSTNVSTPYTGGNGASGVVIVWEYA